ncbi:MAG TPA: ABC-F family ATP-binding cassette domain-containing protein [Spirochaetia bacterium]|nr:ABC-F family ATP-binding cassette domain-containing protein [Spirochaetales bacterium]HRY78959.1 ABC-F family ATP-binding cassette domain-containing protein [Spirochaetia bacterium]
MAFVQFTDVSLAFGHRDILKNASLFLAPGTKAALAGPNGAGKTTLLKIAAGLIAPDGGDRAIQKGARISYLPQTGVVYRGCTVYEEAERAYQSVEALVREQEEIGRRLEGSVADDPRTLALVEEHHRLHEAVEGSGYWRRKDRIREVLQGLGFKAGDPDRPVEEFSGGWQMRVALAKVLLENPDILLLDEPTNYLDLEARDWLEDFLRGFPGGFVVVSHDRSFLDSAVTQVYELWNGRLTRYEGTYSAYERTRAQELETLLKDWEKQQEEIAKLEDFIRRFRYQASKATLVQSRVKQLERIVPIEIPEGMKRIHFRFPPAPKCGRIALTVEGLSKAYGDKSVVRDLSLTLDSGWKVAFVGRNGAGKSTLMRLVAGVDRDFRGTLRLGSGVTTAYFAQDVAESLDGTRTVEEEALSVCPTDLIPSIRGLLGAFLFRGDDIYKSVRVLSGGERSRLALLKMLLHPANLLVMDEPTNHLDLDSKDVLLSALKAFEGTVLFVSHDRFFLEELADRVLELECGSVPRFYPGGYDYYREKRAALDAEAAAGAGKAAPVRSGPAVSPGKAAPGAGQPAGTGSPRPSGTAQSWEEEKARKAALRRLQKREEEILARLATLGAQKAAAEAEMGKPENYSDGARMKRLQEAAAALDAEAERLNLEWEDVALRLSAEQ